VNVAKLKEALSFTYQGLHYLLWPAVCVNCGQSICEADNNLCKSCWTELLSCAGADYCTRCGRDASRYAFLEGACPNCRGREIHFDRIARSGVYAQSLKKMISDFKFAGKRELDLPLAFLANSALQGSDFAGEIDLFVPVPLHWTRRVFRGYNQSLVLAKKIRLAAAKIDANLVRIRRTKAQWVMSSDAGRLKNVAGAFAVRRGHRFSGKKVCLVDDIKTSGATLNECAKTLKQAGASKVFALVLAVAGQDVS
jgi:ComF family protein